MSEPGVSPAAPETGGEPIRKDGLPSGSGRSAARRFRKKPVVIEAMQYDGSEESQRAIVNWTNGKAEGWVDTEYHLLIRTLEGNHRANAGDWIIRGVQGEFYPCKPDIFEETYEPA